MKKLILLFAIACANANAQIIVPQNGYAILNICSVSPDTVDAGDSLKVVFYIYPPQGVNSYTQCGFALYSANPTVSVIPFLWRGNYNYLYTLPIQVCLWAGGPYQDSCRVVKLKIPDTTATGAYRIYATNETQPSNYFYVKGKPIGAPTGFPTYSFDPVAPIYFDLYGQPSERRPGVVLIEQVGACRRKVIFQD